MAAELAVGATPSVIGCRAAALTLDIAALLFGGNSSGLRRPGRFRRPAWSFDVERRLESRNQALLGE